MAARHTNPAKRSTRTRNSSVISPPPSKCHNKDEASPPRRVPTTKPIQAPIAVSLSPIANKSTSDLARVIRNEDPTTAAICSILRVALNANPCSIPALTKACKNFW